MSSIENTTTLRLWGDALRLAARMVTSDVLPEPCGPETPRKKGGELAVGLREMWSERRGRRKEVKRGVLSLITGDMLVQSKCCCVGGSPKRGSVGFACGGVLRSYM